jgi:hypothetical protein
VENIWNQDFRGFVCLGQFSVGGFQVLKAKGCAVRSHIAKLSIFSIANWEQLTCSDFSIVNVLEG